MDAKTQNGKAGFSLIEICLAILVVALGLVAIFGLFPGGLRSSESAVADTASSLFADSVLSGLRANADATTNWAAWSTPGFPSNIVAGFSPAIAVTGLGSGAVQVVEFPPGSGKYIRYRLSIADGTNSRIKGVTIYANSGRYGAFAADEPFYTELFYHGL